MTGGGALRERGRPARMHSRCVPLSFPAMRQPATLPAGTAWARPKQNRGAVASRAGSRRRVRLCQCCAGGTPALPGGPSSRDIVAAKQVRRSSCPFTVRENKRYGLSQILACFLPGLALTVGPGNFRTVGNVPFPILLDNRCELVFHRKPCQLPQRSFLRERASSVFSYRKLASIKTATGRGPPHERAPAEPPRGHLQTGRLRLGIDGEATPTAQGVPPIVSLQEAGAVPLRACCHARAQKIRRGRKRG